MRDDLISKELIHLFKRPVFSLGEEEEVTHKRDEIPREEEVEEFEPHVCQCNRSTLCKHEIEAPVREGRQGVSTRTDFSREDLGWIDP